MKQLLFILQLVLWSVCAHAQEKGISLKMKAATFAEIMTEVEKQAQVNIVFNPQDCPQGKINTSIVNDNWRVGLRELLSKYKLECIINGKQVVITKKQNAKAKHILSGYIKDISSGESVGDAAISIGSGSDGVRSNAYGYYSISVPEGDVDISISHIAYNGMQAVLQIESATQKDFKLTMAKGKSIGAVVVKAKTKTVKQHVASTEIGKIELPIAMIKKVPTLFGESDVLKVMQLMPGIKRGGEGTIGMYVRGGGSDENLIQLDEATVYNAGHLLGFFSVFNSNALKDVTFYKGGFPANYGGRLSSIMDVRMKDGNITRHKAEGSVGLISSNLTLEGPILKDKMSYTASGRRTYIDKVFKLVNVPLPYYFYDANVKVNYKISNQDKLFLSGYFGNDILKFDDGDLAGIAGTTSDSTQQQLGNLDIKSSSNLGNFTSTLRWNHVFKNQKLFMNTSLIQTRFRYDIKGGTAGALLGVSSSIQDYGGKVDFNYSLNNNNQIKFGTELTQHTFRPNIVSLKADTAINAPIKAGKKLNNFEYAFYANNDQTISEKIKLNYGLRFSGTLADSAAYAGIEPRVNVRYKINEVHSIKASYTKMRQYMHLVSSSNLALPTDLWYPVTKTIKPSVSDQVSVGYFTGIQKINTLISVEAYYKTMNNLIEYREGAVLIFSNKFEQEMVRGKGKAYGVELFVNKTQGKFTGWVGYTLAYSKRQFDSLNKGQWYYAKYDRRHDVSVVACYDISKRVSVSSAFVYSSGSPFTARIGQFLAPNPSLTGVDFVPIYSARNAYRLSAQHRLDIDFTIKSLPRKHWQGEWHIGAYNVYNRAQPNRVSLVVEPNGSYKYEQRGLFGIIPSIAYNFKIY
jgi:hypothetical protein